MPYKIDGTEFSLEPTSGRWLPRDVLGIDGNGHPIYPSAREFEVRWDIQSMSEFDQIRGFFSSLTITGSAVATLPQYDASSYGFKDYSGCVVQEPQIGRYFHEHPTDVRLLITNIST